MLKHLAMETAIAACDAVFFVLPQPKPPVDALRRCKIISHRGEHDNRKIKENTLEAFRTACEAGSWGIEFDIRWTADLVPVVIHDADTSRVFGGDTVISDTSFSQLRAKFPLVPSLEELVAEFGGKTHLMLEIKEEIFPDPEKQKQELANRLSTLEPGKDFHVLALDTRLFETFDVFPSDAFLPVAMLNTGEMSHASLERAYGGLTGHYLLISRFIQAKHEKRGQGIGPGFIRSRNSLYREINRGAEWIFTNDAVKLMQILNRELNS